MNWNKNYIIAGLVVIVVAGGGYMTFHKDSNTTANQTTSAVSSSTTGDSTGAAGQNQSSSSTKSKYVKFNTLATANKDTVWFKTFDSSPTRDSDILSVYVTKNGKITEYDTDPDTNDSKNGLTVKDIQKLSDAQIIAKAKQLDKAIFNERKAAANDTYTNALNNLPSDSQPDAASTITKIKNDYSNLTYKAPIAVPIKITASDDGKSSTVLAEKFSVASRYAPQVVDGSGSSSAIGDYEGYTSDIHLTYAPESDDVEFRGVNYLSTTIDGTDYAGWSAKFFTRVKGQVAFQKDDPKAKLITDHDTFSDDSSESNSIF